MKIIAAVLVLSISLTSCTNEGKSLRVLEDQGYTKIEMKGYGWFSCGRGDIFADRFAATNSNGVVVRGTVCSGLLKGSTIRFD